MGYGYDGPIWLGELAQVFPTKLFKLSFGGGTGFAGPIAPAAKLVGGL